MSMESLHGGSVTELMTLRLRLKCLVRAVAITTRVLCFFAAHGALLAAKFFQD